MRSLHSCRISLKKALDQEGLEDVIDQLYNLGNSKLVRSRHATACRKCGRVEAEIKRRESTTPKEPLVVPAGRDVTGLFFGSRAFEHHEEVRESVFQTANRSILTDVCFLIYVLPKPCLSYLQPTGKSFAIRLFSRTISARLRSNFHGY